MLDARRVRIGRLADVDIALGSLVDLVRSQSRAYLKAKAARKR